MHNFSHETFSKSGSSFLTPHADPTALTTQIWGEKINSEREERNLNIWSIKFLLFGHRSSVKAFHFGADATKQRRRTGSSSDWGGEEACRSGWLPVALRKGSSQVPNHIPDPQNNATSDRPFFFLFLFF
jgi:hypothetical protein